MSRSLEIERKYDADADFVVPEMHGVDECAGASDPVIHLLAATYFDTADLRLATARVTLRRRTGGDDAGWHLKLRVSGDARLEIRLPLDSSPDGHTVPAQLVDLVAGSVRDADLVPVAELQTIRTERHLLGAGGEVIAKLADDSVTARRLGSDPPAGNAASPAGGAATAGDSAVSPDLAWREIEVELVGGTVDFLKAAGKRLRGAGARRATSASKLGRLLGDAVRPGHNARDAPVIAYLRAQTVELLAIDPLVRLADHDDDSVHKMRVASRRIRSVLSSHERLLGGDRQAALDAELRWLAGVLGEVRDLEVMRARFATLLAGIPGVSVVPRPIAALAATEGQARDRLRRALSSPRYFALLDTLDALIADPLRTHGGGIQPHGDRVADVHSVAAAGKAWRKMARAHRRAKRLPAGSARDTALHAMRKAAKRARYTAEAARDVVGDSAIEAADHAKRLQEILGAHQDGVIAHHHLARLAMLRTTSKADAFTLGRLAGMEYSESTRVLDDLPTAWRKAKKFDGFAEAE